MAKTAGGFYAVRKGRVLGIYTTWDTCEKQVRGFPGAKYQKFASKAQAEAYITSSEVPQPSSAPIDTNSKSNPSKSIPSKGKKRTFAEMQTPLLISEIDVSVEPLVVYCDGACKGNGKAVSVAGIGVWWGHNDPRNLAERCPGEQTNNRAELIAICRVLETTPYRKSLLTIKTDSRYSISCFNDWLQKWMDNGWRKTDGSAVKNPELIHYIATLLASRFRIGQSVKLEHVKGHSGIEGNEGADSLANLGATLSEEDERDWASLREAYLFKVEELIEERRLQLAAKDKGGSLEVVGAEEVSQDLREETESKTLDEEATGTQFASKSKVRRVGEEAGASVKDAKTYKKPAVRLLASRRYSAGVAEPSDEDLEAFAQDQQEDEDQAAPPSRKASQSKPLLERRYSARVEKPTEEDLAAYADAWDEEIDVSEIE